MAPNCNGGLMGCWLFWRVGFAPFLGERAAREGTMFFVCLLRRPPAPTSCSPPHAWGPGAAIIIFSPPARPRGRPCHYAKLQRRVDGFLFSVVLGLLRFASGRRREKVLRSSLLPFTPPPAPTSLPCSLCPSAPLPPLSPCCGRSLTAPPDLLVYGRNWNGLETVQSMRVNCCVFRWGFILLVAAGRGRRREAARRSSFTPRAAFSPLQRSSAPPLLCSSAPPPPHHPRQGPITTAASPTAVSNTAVAPCGSPAPRCVASVSA